MSFIEAAKTKAELGLEWATKWHMKIMPWVIGWVTFFLAMGVLANKAGYPGLNFILAAVALIVAVFFLTKPFFISVVFGAGAGTEGLPDFKFADILDKGFAGMPNLELEKFFGAGGKLIQETAKKVAHLLLFLTVLFVVLGTFPLSDTRYALPALIVLAGFGLWSSLYATKSVWYKRITLTILLVAGAIVFFKLYYPKDEVEKIDEARNSFREERLSEELRPLIRKSGEGIKLTEEEAIVLEKARAKKAKQSLLKKVGTYFHGMEIEYQVPSNIAPENLKPICGIAPGEYSIHVSEGSRLLINAGGTMAYEPLAGKPHVSLPQKLHRPDYRPFGLMINGGGDGEEIIVNKSGCAVVSFNTMFGQDEAFRTGELKVVNSTILFRLQPE